MLSMHLPVDKALPSFCTLKDYGNTSCSTTWWVQCGVMRLTGGGGGTEARMWVVHQLLVCSPADTVAAPALCCRYTMAYTESTLGVRKGEKTMQVYMGMRQQL